MQEAGRTVGKERSAAAIKIIICHNFKRYTLVSVRNEYWNDIFDKRFIYTTPEEQQEPIVKHFLN